MAQTNFVSILAQKKQFNIWGLPHSFFIKKQVKAKWRHSLCLMCIPS